MFLSLGGRCKVARLQCCSLVCPVPSSFSLFVIWLGFPCILPVFSASEPCVRTLYVCVKCECARSNGYCSKLLLYYSKAVRWFGSVFEPIYATSPIATSVVFWQRVEAGLEWRVPANPKYCSVLVLYHKLTFYNRFFNISFCASSCVMGVGVYKF